MSSVASADELARQALASGYEEVVEVNQRALVEKILARYSGEYTVFRELLQNADDATASSVEIHFQTEKTSSVSNLKTEKVTKILVKNDGIVFRDEDWKRLRTIADGQPNEERIGAFGVGFYSIWSHSDDPLVISGDSMMYFYWKGNQLAVKRATNPQAAEVAPSGRPWTVVSMPCREPEPMPNAADFSKFLATALAFTAHIKTMTLYYGSNQLCRLEKKAAPSQPLQAPPHTILRSPGKTMDVASIEATPLQIDCSVMRAVLASVEKPQAKKSQEIKQNFATRFLSFASSRSVEAAPQQEEVPKVDPAEKISTAVFLRIVTAKSRFSAPAAFVAEIERSTKKKPPASSKIQLLFTTKDEADAGRAAGDASTADSARSVFSGLVQEAGKQGRIFIGFGTHQSTGCAASIASHLVPTVERENLDLQNRHIADYNRELLSVAGIVARCVYDSEMGEIARLWKAAGIKPDSKDDAATSLLVRRASHLLQFFTFRPSTPISEVGATIQASFFNCNTREFMVVSSKGILPSSKVRLPASELSFLSGLSIVPDPVAKENQVLLDQLTDRGLIRSITIEDVVAQLQEKPLGLDEAVALLKWWISLSWNSSCDPRLLSRLRDATVISYTDEQKQDRIVALRGIKHFLNTKTISPDMPLAPSVLPYAISKTLQLADLSRVFGWSEFPLVDWLRYLASPDCIRITDTSITLSPAFSEKVLGSLSRVWGNTPPAQATQIVTILQPLACIPTKMGMKLPVEAYFPKVNLFDDLPVTTLQIRGSMEKLLSALGVRKSADLALVFSRLLGGGQWQEEQVAKYLVSVASSLTAEEKDRLTKTAWLTKESEDLPPKYDVNDTQAPSKPHRFKARSLYEPTEALRELELPLLAWKGSKWRSNSEEARLLFSLGLNRHPPVEEILKLASDPANPDRRRKALSYFLNNFESVYNQPYQPTKHTLSYVPVIQEGKKTFASPTEAFSSNGSSVMGFATLDPDYQLQAAKFKLSTDPRSADLVSKLVNNPPREAATAIPIFSYLAGQASRFTSSDFTLLASAKFIPVQPEPKGPINLYAPRSVYFPSTEGSIATQFASLFTFVNFGTSANAFLLQCGVRAEPTAGELTQLLLVDPKRFLTLSGSSERYISLLRQIAAHYNTFSSSLKKKMRDTPFLLGFEHVRNSTGSKEKAQEEDEDETDGLLQYRLGFASDIVIIDDTTASLDFREQILACPQDDLVEAFVEQLGGKRISRLVSTNFTSTPVPETASPRATGLRKLILERVTLFLHERQQTSKDVRHSEEWLKEHLVVKEVTRIERQRVLTSGVSRFVKTSTASAAATSEKGTLLLRISANLNDLDFYEVAAALTGIILSKQKIHDTLLFMTLLQTSLRDLKRRGFNVDRIMNARRAEQEAIEQKQRQERNEADMKRIQDQHQRETSAPPAYDNKRTSLSGADSEKRSLLGAGSSATPPPTIAPPTAKTLFNSFKEKLRQSPLASTPAIEALAGESASVPGGFPQLPSPVAQKRTSIPDSESQVTPRSNIATNVHRAIAASKPDRSGNITTEVDTKEIKEASSSYCDSTPASDLDYVTDVLGVRFYISRSVDPNENILQRYGEDLKRYISDVVKPVGQVFNVDPAALHVFYDRAGPLIAFNRSGSIFYNLRYHLAWHGDQVRAGKLDDALISTYFSTAHELAHNLVLPHNSEHSFYTSSIAQNYFTKMADHISSIS